MSVDLDFLDEISRLNNELVNAKRELAQKNLTLERANLEKDKMLGFVTHDLRNPIGVVLAVTELLLDKYSSDPETISLLGSASRSCFAMMKLVEDLLGVSGASMGRLRLQREIILPSELISDCVEMNRILSAPRQTAIQLKIPDFLPPASLDPGKINQVLNNLIGNAVKYSPRAAAVIVEVIDHGDGFETRIHDQGPGIPVGTGEKLFTPFYTTGVKPAGNEPSTGLGLAICKNIVNAHMGSIGFENSPEGGVAFWFRLPYRDPS